ncbi:MAG: type IV toxin-antitoxin system AbiEi family antitoxin domain-containing protein [bacterium]|nr:type IV toxin-antitoxin system AbiEi family antitoxin domain-containing protein [bacterium]
MSTNNLAGNKQTLILLALRNRGIIRTRDLTALGVSREYVRQLALCGVLERTGRGLYRLPDSDMTEFHSMVEASQRVPRGTICLLSALRYHRITTQAPFEVWMAIGSKVRQPHVPDIPLRFVRSSGDSFTEGIEINQIEGLPVSIYSLEKTVVDCFKYRNKIGMDVALEALRESLRSRRIDIDELWRCAKICRVANIMRPYLEAIG